MPVLVGQGTGHTCVSMLLRRATTLCVEDPSLFDLTKAMVDPKPNAEFSLSVISACEVCTGEFPCSRRLHVSLRWTTCATFPTARSRVMQVRTSLCSRPCRVLFCPRPNCSQSGCTMCFFHDNALPHSAGYVLAQSSGGHEFPVLVWSPRVCWK